MFLYISLIFSSVFLLIFTICIYSIDGISPPFVRQEIDDLRYDLFYDDIHLSQTEISECTKSDAPVIDMEAVSYESNGSNLNATVWLTSEFNNLSKISHIRNTYNDKTTELSYDFGIVNSTDTISNFIKKLLLKMKSSKFYDLIEILPLNSSKYNYEKYKIIFKLKNNFDDTIEYYFFENGNTIYVERFFTTHYKENLPMIEKIINSTELIKYNNTSFATYENPSYGLKFEYPVELISKDFTIGSFSDSNSPVKGYPKIFLKYYLSGQENNSELINLDIYRIHKLPNFTLEDTIREIVEMSNRNFVITGIPIKKYVSALNTSGLFYSMQNEENDAEVYDIMSTYETNNDTIFLFNYKAEKKYFAKYLPIIEKIINSTELIKYNNTSFATYENPSYGLKFEYPIKNFIPPAFSTKFVKVNESYPLLVGSNVELDNDYFIPITDILHTIYTQNDTKPEIHIQNVIYYMLIDITSTYDKGTDYVIGIRWNESSSQWDRTFSEQSSTSTRIIDTTYNVSDFYSKASPFDSVNGYLRFSLDMSKINNPDKYKMVVGSIAQYMIGHTSCKVQDVSQILPIPPPNYSINPIINHTLILYPNDEKTLDLQINSNSPTDSIIFLKSKHSNTINVTFSPNTFYLNPNEKGISTMKIKTSGSNIGTHNIPILANATFPHEMEFVLDEHKTKIFNPVDAKIPISTILTLTVENPPPWFQGPIDTLNIIGGPLTPIATAVTIISGVLGLNIWNRKKRNRKKIKQKSNNKKM